MKCKICKAKSIVYIISFGYICDSCIEKFKKYFKSKGYKKIHTYQLNEFLNFIYFVEKYENIKIDKETNKIVDKFFKIDSFI